jgi:hypothetical protein
MKFGNIVRRGSVVVMGAATVTALGIGAPTASAGTTQTISTPYAGTFFYHGTNTLYVEDYAVDGRGARAYLTSKGGSIIAQVHDADGPDGYGVDKDVNKVDEGTVVWLRLCYTNNGDNTECSERQKAVT